MRHTSKRAEAKAQHITVGPDSLPVEGEAITASCRTVTVAAGTIPKGLARQ